MRTRNYNDMHFIYSYRELTTILFCSTLTTDIKEKNPTKFMCHRIAYLLKVINEQKIVNSITHGWNLPLLLFTRISSINSTRGSRLHTADELDQLVLLICIYALYTMYHGRCSHFWKLYDMEAPSMLHTPTVSFTHEDAFFFDVLFNPIHFWHT